MTLKIGALSIPQNNQIVMMHDCRSTPARHAANPYRKERHPNAQKKLKHSTKLSL